MPGASHHGDLSSRSQAQKAKQPAISARAAPTYANKVNMAVRFSQFAPRRQTLEFDIQMAVVRVSIQLGRASSRTV